MSETAHLPLLDAVAAAVRDAGRFERVEVVDGLLRAHARDVEEPAWYQVGPLETIDRASRLWVGMYTPDRWLSESIEADVLHQGDKFSDLLEEEMVDQGLEAGLAVEHFRNDEKVFVFRSPLALEEAQDLGDPALAERVAKAVMAYEACFRELGDMSPGDELL